MSTPITITGNLTADPEVRYTPSGTPVAAFTVAHNRGKDDRKVTDFYRCEAWEEQALHVAETLRKGQRVIVVGEMRSSDYETRDGQKRTTWEVRAYDVGPSLRWAKQDAPPVSSFQRSAPNPAGDWGADGEAPF